MIEKWVNFALARARWAVVLVIGGALLALIATFHLRFDALPDVTGRQVMILTRAAGFTPQEVERIVTRLVEMRIGGVPGLKSQRSISRYGISSVTAVFDEDVPILRARQLIQESLQSIATSLPNGVDAPELGPMTGGLGEIYHFSLHSDKRSTTELYELARWQIAPLLRSVPGIVEVNTWGGRERTLDVIANPSLMASYKVTMNEVIQAVRAASGQVAGATLHRGQSGTLLRGVSWPRSSSELAATVLRLNEDGTVIRIGDVASVQDGARPRLGAATLDGRGETVYVMLQMLLEANALEVLKDVHTALPKVREALPPDVEIEEVYDRSELVYATLKTVAKNLLEGGLLVIFVLFFLLGSLRAGLLVASLIPLSMLGAIVAMVFFDVPANLMSLGALDFGLLVDGGIVMVESVFHEMQQKKVHVRGCVDRVSNSMARPVFFSVLIILLVYIPILSLQGVEGKMFRPMVLTVVFALSTALVLSLLFIPPALRLFLRDRDVPKQEPWLIRKVQSIYEPELDRMLKRPLVVATTAVLLLGSGIYLFAHSGSAFIPQLDEGDLVIQTLREPDIRVQSAVNQSLLMEEDILRKVPEVNRIVSRIGSPAVATDIMGLEQADVFVDLKDKDQWREGLSKSDLIAQIEKAVSPSAKPKDMSFTQPIQMRFNELLGGEVSDVGLSFYSENLTELNAVAKQAVRALKKVDGAQDVRVSAPPSVSVIEVRPNPLAAAQFGFSPEDVLNHVQALRRGVDAGLTYDGPIRVPLRVRFDLSPDAYRASELPLVTAQGHTVALRNVAKVERMPTPAMVNRNNGFRRVVVGFNVRGRDLATTVQDAQVAIAKHVDVPTGMRLEWGGQYKSLKSAQARLAVVIPAVLVLIFLLLFILFRSIRIALIILLNVPFAAVGGIMALYARGLPVSISAAVGFIALSGIAVLNGVVLMNALVAKEQQGASPMEAARFAAHNRLRPVLMTALVAALGFVPMMLATGVGSEVQRPLATVVVGGLVTSTLLTLGILPTLYPWLSSFRYLRRKKGASETSLTPTS
ncbi:MAG: efflux RND transporter permease subunit [Myxococcales bacterium]|nr:MAG: efflux RND transporter permease subunit [Myxococcales bacterium]